MNPQLKMFGELQFVIFVTKNKLLCTYEIKYLRNRHKCIFYIEFHFI